MYRAILLWSLVVFLTLPTSALSEKTTPDLEAETQALIQRLVLDRAATIDALKRSADERDRRRLAELADKDRRLRAEIGKRKAAQEELLRVTAERQRLVDEIAANDRQFAVEIAEYRKQVASIANSPDPRKRAALARYAEGDREGAFAVLVEIQTGETKAVAAGWREIAALALDQKDRGEMTTTEVLPFYEKAQQLDPDHFWVWIELCRLYQEAGRLPDATRAAQKALDHAQDDRDRATAAIEFGEVLVAAGELQSAKARFEEALATLQRLAQANPTSAVAQRNLSISLNKLGDVLVVTGDLQGAKARFEEALATRQRLAQAFPTSAEAQRDLSISLQRLGDVLVAAGDLQDAQARFEAIEHWEPQEHTLPLTVGTTYEPLSSEAAAQADALARAPADAELACVGFKAASYRLRAATPKVVEWDCRPSLGGFICGFKGQAICQVEAHTRERREVCR